MNVLPRCTPEEVGISSAQVSRCIRALNHDKTTMNGFMAACHGKVFAQCWWSPYAPELVHSNHSFGKSYTATAIGIAFKEKLVDLNEKMTDIFAEEIRERQINLPDKMDRITVEHVLTMTNGMAYHPQMTGDFIRHYFTTPIAYEPGTRFAYNSVGSCMLGAIISKRTGMEMKAYLTHRLFEKIGIDPEVFVWRKFPNGIDAEPGTFATTEQNLRLAMLYLNGGRWNGEQILDEAFVKSALSVHISTEYAPEQKDGLCGYGYQLWACSIPGVYRFDGGQGQYGIIWPEKDLAVSIHEGAMGPLGPQKTLDALYENLLLHVNNDSLPEDPQALLQLRELERNAALPNDPPNSLPINAAFNGNYRVQEGVFDPWLSAAPPGNGDLFTMFRDQDKNHPTKQFSLTLTQQQCIFRDETGGCICASLDGTLTCRFTASPFPPLGAYAASARMETPSRLVMDIHWLNGWFETLLEFEKMGDGLQITARKLRLNEDDNYLIYTAKAKEGLYEEANVCRIRE